MSKGYWRMRETEIVMARLRLELEEHCGGLVKVSLARGWLEMLLLTASSGGEGG